MNKVIRNFAYFGAKSKFIKELKEYIEDSAMGCHTFIDGFGGSGVVTLNIDMFERRIINDLNIELFTIHKVLSNPTLADGLLSLIQDSELSKDCFLQSKKVWEPYKNEIFSIFKNKMLSTTEAAAFEWQKDMWKQFISEERLVEMAAAALLIYKHSFNGQGQSSKSDSYFDEDKKYYNWVDNSLEQVIEQMEGVEAYCVNALVLVNKYKHDPGVFMYLDSPYERRTRIAKKAYKIDMNDNDQQQYIDTIIDSKAPILISGYKYEGKSVYDRLVDAGWHCEIIVEDVCKTSSTNGFDKPRVDEWVWFNY